MANIAMHAMLATCWATATGPAASHLTHAVSLKRVNTIPLWASSGRRTCDFQTVSMYCTAEFSLRNTFPALYLHMQHRARPSARCTFYSLCTPQSAQRDKWRFQFSGLWRDIDSYVCTNVLCVNSAIPNSSTLLWKSQISQARYYLSNPGFGNNSSSL